MAVARGVARRHRARGGGLAGWLAAGAERLGGRSVPLTTSYPLGLARGAAILDYGCGSGWWLRELRARGYSNLWAYDVEQPALQQIRSEGIRVLVNPAPLPRAAFDCVRLEHVVEHLINPLEALARVKLALAPDGVIVLVVPNYGSWSARTAGLAYGGLDLPRHLSHFTEQSLRGVAAPRRPEGGGGAAPADLGSGGHRTPVRG